MPVEFTDTHELWINTSSHRGETLCIEPIYEGVNLVSFKPGVPLRELLQGHRPLYGTASSIRDQIPLLPHEHQKQAQREDGQRSKPSHCISASCEVVSVRRALTWWLSEQSSPSEALIDLEQELDFDPLPLQEAYQHIISEEHHDDWKHQLSATQGAEIVMLVLEWQAADAEEEAGGYCHKKISQCFHLIDQVQLDKKLTELTMVAADQGHRYFKSVTHWPLSIDFIIPDLKKRLLLRQQSNNTEWLACALPARDSALQRDEVAISKLEVSDIPAWVQDQAAGAPVHLGAMADSIRIHHHQYDFPSFESCHLSEITSKAGIMHAHSYSSLTALRDACRERNITGFTNMDRAEMLYAIARIDIEECPASQVVDAGTGCFLNAGEADDASVLPGASREDTALICHTMSSGLILPGGESNPLRFTGEHPAGRLTRPLNPYHHQACDAPQPQDDQVSRGRADPNLLSEEFDSL